MKGIMGNTTTTGKETVPTNVIESLPFANLKQAIQRRFNEIKGLPAYRSSVSRDALWDMYLASFPDGTNPTFRERTEHDCSSCRAFVKNVGSLVVIVDGELATIWDVEVGGQYQPVVDALAEFVKAAPIENIFLHGQHPVSTDKNFEEAATGVLTWEHLHVTLPDSMLARNDQIGPRLSEARSSYYVMLRSLREIRLEAVETVQDLIAQNSLYRGAEKKALVDEFARLLRAFDQLPAATGAGEIFAWKQVTANAWVCRVRNDVIGTLLVDLSEGVDLERAVKTFEDKVSGTNYKRPTALVTPKMRDAARKTVEELGLAPSLERRFARLEDISINNVLFADRSAKQRLAGDVFDDIPVSTSTKNFDRIEEISIDKFISDVLPTASSVEVMFENKHRGNMVSLVAPYDLTAKPLFKWSNPFSWSYNGDVADSIKERVKAAGGNVTGEICCRLAWFNYDDLDFHMREPKGGHISYRDKRSSSGGQLDVDMNAGGGDTRTPVENIFYTRTPAHGTYSLSVHQFAKRETKDAGFDVEIDVMGEVVSFSHAGVMLQDHEVKVADIVVSADGVEVKPLMPSTQAQKEAWGLKTQEFHRVTAIMLSPNHWDGEGIGNKHFFFMLDGCQNDGSARGFYNEFLSSELEPHRKTMELVGSRMRTEESGDQMSGIGFSSTQRNSVVVKVSGSFQRTLKITF